MSAYSDKVILDGALFYWRLGESAGTTAVDQKGILNGSHVGSVVVGQAGGLGASGDTDLSALYGTSGARTEIAADSRHQSLAANWTVEAWVYRLGAMSNELAIVTHTYVPGDIPCVLRIQADSTASAARYHGGWEYANDVAVLPLNAWTHLVATHSGPVGGAGGTLRLYRNGALVATTTTNWGNAAAPATAKLWIATRWDSNDSFNGRIDEVALYPTALNATQILAHYTAGTTLVGPTQIVGATVTNLFTVGDGHLAGGIGPSPVFPYGYPVCGPLLCGAPICGLPFPSQFGAVTIAVSFPQSRAVTGLASAQAFGAVAVKAVLVRAVAGVGTAQAFGTPKLNITRSAGGVSSAQQFGVPTPKTAVTCAVGAVASAQAFGALTFTTALTRAVAGLGSAQQFGVPKFNFTRAAGGVSSAQSFGVPSSGLRFVVAGVASAQVFGVAIPRVAGQVVVIGVPSAQAFGTPTARFTFEYLHELHCLTLALTPSVCIDEVAA